MVHPADPPCGVTGEHPALCGGGSGSMHATQLTLFAGSLVNTRSLRRGFRLLEIQERPSTFAKATRISGPLALNVVNGHPLVHMLLVHAPLIFLRFSTPPLTFVFGDMNWPDITFWDGSPVFLALPFRLCIVKRQRGLNTYSGTLADKR